MTPERTCIGCRTTRPQAALVRVALDTDDRVVLSRRAPGRGAWLCAMDRGPDARCARTALSKHAFDRAFRRSLPAGALDAIAGELTKEA